MASKDGYMLSGICPDKQCQTKLFFPLYASSIECTQCGQHHERSVLQQVQEVSNPEIALQRMLKNVIVSTVPKKGAEMVKVLGLSNYHCKLLSPLLTVYGMNKSTGKAKLLSDMNQGKYFDCSVLGNRTFLIDPEHISIVGYGRDISGSVQYLSGTLELVKDYNDGEERLIPVHADGDGHCLVHAISRALIGRELFWHPLRCNLKRHFEENLQKYKELLKEFIDEREWDAIIAECDPDFVPSDGELLGLRNIHIFGLANVLKRPIILLDSLAGMQSLGDYSGLFLPSLVKPEECRDKNQVLNKPLCIAWNSSGRNHYIPLVGIKGKILPKLPRHLIPKVWGVPQNLIDKYMEFDDCGCCIIGGERTLGDQYILRLASAMEEVFMEKYNVHPALVADVHHYAYQRTGIVGAKPQVVIQATQQAVQEKRLYRCLLCDGICEQQCSHDWFVKGGSLYKIALSSHGPLQPNKRYCFSHRGIVCRYDQEKDELVPETPLTLDKCLWCHGQLLRLVNKDGSIQYKNGDRTKTPRSSTKHSNCSCGYKHYWNGKEYDSIPQQLPIILEWNDKVIHEIVTWFQYESDAALNSNVYDVASEVVQKHFPGAFGSERLIQRVVHQILEQTKEQTDDVAAAQNPVPYEQSSPSASIPQKMIICGTKILHKEELGASETERQIMHRMEQLSSTTQKKRSSEKSEHDLDEISPKTSPAKSVPRRDIPTPPPPVDTLLCSPSTSLKTSSHGAKFVRVVTSDGRQSKLILDSNKITFSKLQDWIRQEFLIPPAQQRIKYGFPPQELHPPSDGQKDKGIILSHGERMIVEVLPENKEQKNTAQSTSNSQDPLDSALLSLLITANISGSTVWEFVQKHPHFFDSGGLFYRQAERDLGLSDGKHCHLPLLPNKTFRYNAAQDRLELCLEPHGHFPVTEKIDSLIKKIETEKKSGDMFKSVASGVINVGSKQTTVPTAFQGTGHVLRAPIDGLAEKEEEKIIGTNLEDTVGDSSALSLLPSDRTDESNTSQNDTKEARDSSKEVSEPMETDNL
ncbi:deubiquitinating protein VCIP135-like [Centruroides sculpturatus]|uniref:deubiquitinating protein VCIP135-like n=1 Tax=Centruroides sculpturatus TaxID=218467 RepID=UPI000C6CA6FC|nr:deubiquitinating protein VCIP135-like [Centruroides sculpturatus]